MISPPHTGRGNALSKNSQTVLVPPDTPEAASLFGFSLTRQTAAALAISLTFGLLMVLYGSTMARDLTWAHDSQDGGELITAAVTLGVPHPPGYPTYVAVGKLFSLIPLGTVAFRLNLLSAVSVALAAGLLAGSLQLRGQATGRAVAASITAGLVFGLLPPVWGQASVAEVYGLNLLLAAATLLCLVGLRRSLLTGLFLGLAVTGHPSSLLLAPLAFGLTPHDQRTRLLTGIVIGLLPLVLLPVFANTNSPVVWGDPRTLSGWWWVASGQLYGANWLIPLSWVQITQTVGRTGLWFAPLLIIAGIAIPLWWRLPISRYDSAQASLVWPIGLTLVAYGLLPLSYGTTDAYVLLLPGLLLLVYLVFATGRLPIGLAIIVAALLFAGGIGSHNLRHEPAVRPLAESVLAAAPERAILLTPGDRTVFTLWYFHHVEAMRPDLIVVDENLFAFDWYRANLASRYPDLGGLEIDDLERFQIVNSTMPLCLTGLLPTSARPAPPGYTYLVGAEDEAPYLICRESQK